MNWAAKLARDYRIDDGKGFRLKHFKTNASEAKTLEVGALDKGIAEMTALQDKLYAQNRWAVLLIFQAMDAAGKDGVIKHVMSGVNPQGCQVFSFKQPSTEELNHDFLWRATRCLPERGKIGIFNRSYYEETLIVRVHPEILQAQRIPPALLGKEVWEQRFHDIRAFEKHLTHNGTVIRKFFLYLSPEEQKKRFMARLHDPQKNWKFSADDVKERGFWNQYMDAYEETIASTATKSAPWFVIPADNKAYAHAVVAAAIVQTLQDLDLAYPVVDEATKKKLAAARKSLLQQKH